MPPAPRTQNPESAPEAWPFKLAREIQSNRKFHDASLEAQQLLAREIAARGPYLFKQLGEQAREAAAVMQFQFAKGGNWWFVKNASYPFRMLQAFLDMPGFGIALKYTQGSMIGGQNPKVRDDYLDIRLSGEEDNALVLYYAGKLITPAEALETMFRAAFVAKKK